jgi:group I intron endonuclease
MGLIYLITNTSNNKKYVGQTTEKLNKRFNRHKNAAKGGVEFHLYRAMRKHGIDSFKIEVLEEVDDSILSEREKFFIAELNAEYNMTLGGEGCSIRVKPPKTKTITNEIDIKRILLDEEIPAGYVRGLPDSVKMKMRETAKFKIITEEHRSNISKAKTGYKYSEQARQSMKTAQMKRRLKEKEST